MSFVQNDKTKIFVRQVKALLNAGIVRSQAEISEKIEWNRTALANVLAGNRNVPNDVYARFTKVYKPVEVERDNVEQVNFERLIRLEAMASVLLGALAEMLAQQREQPVTKVLNDLVSTVNSQSLQMLGKQR